jgi:hypothetical protein
MTTQPDIPSEDDELPPVIGERLRDFTDPYRRRVQEDDVDA